MINNYVPSTLETVVEYDLAFDDGHFNGFAFPCNENGELPENLPPEAYANYKFCLEHPERFARFNKVVKSEYRIRIPSSGVCHCGQQIDLVDMYYGSCQCDKCGQWYNLFGQEILPPEEWEDNLEDY